MVNKTEKTLEQLKAEAELAQKIYEDKRKELARKEAEEAERKKAELEAEKDKRKKEVDESVQKSIELIKAFNKDFGMYSIRNHLNDLAFLFGDSPLRFFL